MVLAFQETDADCSALQAVFHLATMRCTAKVGEDQPAGHLADTDMELEKKHLNLWNL